jgi:hypothetical protein
MGGGWSRTHLCQRSPPALLALVLLDQLYRHALRRLSRSYHASMAVSSSQCFCTGAMVLAAIIPDAATQVLVLALCYSSTFLLLLPRLDGGKQLPVLLHGRDGVGGDHPGRCHSGTCMY